MVAAQVDFNRQIIGLELRRRRVRDHRRRRAVRNRCRRARIACRGGRGAGGCRRRPPPVATATAASSADGHAHNRKQNRHPLHCVCLRTENIHRMKLRRAAAASSAPAVLARVGREGATQPYPAGNDVQTQRLKKRNVARARSPAVTVVRKMPRHASYLADPSWVGTGPSRHGDSLRRDGPAM